MLNRYNPKHMALITVDMWDNHYCKTFAAWTNELAIRMNPFLDKARELGVQVIHMAADIAGNYKGTPQRDKMLLPPGVNPEDAIPDYDSRPSPPGRWPIGGCVCYQDGNPNALTCPMVYNWSRFNPNLRIDANDLIGDGEELAYYCATHDTHWLYYTGIAGNVCVLDTRPFSMEQMGYLGMKAYLIGDMTESFVTGVPREIGNIRTRLYIHRYVAPVTDSYEFLEGVRKFSV